MKLIRFLLLIAFVGLAAAVWAQNHEQATFEDTPLRSTASAQANRSKIPDPQASRGNCAFA